MLESLGTLCFAQKTSGEREKIRLFVVLFHKFNF